MSNKIQIRRGLQANLPNPLDNGEFGWCTDTRDLYIGNGSLNGNLKVAGAPVTTPFGIYVAAPALGGRPLSEGATGLAKRTGTATQTLPGKLVDGAANFDSSYLNRTLHNDTDDTWAKVILVESPTMLTLSADIMASGEDYGIADALDNIPDAFSQVPGPYATDVTIVVSPGTFSEPVTLVGKTPSGNFNLTLKGDSVGAGTFIAGAVNCRQRIKFTDLKFTARLNALYGADITWTSCRTEGSSKLYVYLGSANLIQNSTITIGNDPTNITAVDSAITKGYTMYVASPALGGNDSTADGLGITSGTATGTAANKLIDSAANFGADLVGKTLYNSTDDTWAKVASVDSPTQLSLSADVMAGGEVYIIANAFSTIQRAIDAIPGTVNCNTNIKVSGETHTAKFIVQGKAYSGNYSITIEGSMGSALSSGASTGANVNYSMGGAGSGAVQATLNDTGKAWGVNAYQNKMVVVTGGTGSGQRRIIDSNTATQFVIAGVWDTLPDNTSTYKIIDWATTLDLSASSTDSYTMELIGQQNIVLKNLNIIEWVEYGIYAHDYSSLSVFNCRFGRSRAGASSGAVQIENYTSLVAFESCLIHEVSGTALARGVRWQLGATPQQTGYNIRNTKVQGTGTALNYASACFQNNSSKGHGLVVRSARIYGALVGTYSVVTYASSIFKFSGTYGLYVANGGYLGIGTTEVSSSGNDGMRLDGYGIGNNLGLNQINNNGGWGVNSINLSYGKNVSTISYTGNISGTYIADTSSKNT